ncbi:MAG: CocE/NonD family hydrolase [Candidatus Thermoplasmatota archaeon]
MRLPVAIVALLMVPPILVGCVTPGSNVEPTAIHLSAATLAPLKPEQVTLTMRDGVKLDNWVIRPDTTEKVPIIIESRPYFGNLDPPAAQGGQKFSKWLVDYFVPRGYAVVLHSIRGTGDSEGCYDQGGIQEQQDEAATIEKFATMEWANGKVASIGKSYGGTTPWEAAIQQPPHLTTIVPIEGITRWYDYLWTNGAYYANGGDFNAEYTATISLNVGPGVPPPSTTQLQNYPGKACQRQAEMQKAGVEAAATGDETAWWQERDYAKGIDKINAANISVYIVHGLQDWNVKPDQIVDVYNKLTVPKRLMLGQQDHQYPLRDDWGTDLLAWFDHYLKGAQNGILQTPPVMVSDSDGKWRTENEWPPQRATPTTLQLSADGKLVTSNAKTGDVPYSAVPGQPPKDGTTGPDRAIWTSEPLPAPTRISGSPTLTFNATFLDPKGQVAATLFLVNDSGWHAISWAAATARHHNGAHRPETITPNQVVSFHLKFEPMEQPLPTGTRLGLVLSSTNAFVPAGGAGSTQIAAGPTAKLTLPTIENEPPQEEPQPTMKAAADLPWTS